MSSYLTHLLIQTGLGQKPAQRETLPPDPFVSSPEARGLPVTPPPSSEVAMPETPPRGSDEPPPASAGRRMAEGRVNAGQEATGSPPNAAPAAPSGVLEQEPPVSDSISHRAESPPALPPARRPEARRAAPSDPGYTDAPPWVRGMDLVQAWVAEPLETGGDLGSPTEVDEMRLERQAASARPASERPLAEASRPVFSGRCVYRWGRST